MTVRRYALLVDDDLWQVEHYAEALERIGFAAEMIASVDDLFPLPHVSGAAPDVVILDMMMPPGNRYAGNPDANDGLRTGILAARDIHHIDPRIAIVLMSSAGGQLERSVDHLNFPVRTVDKVRTLPHEFAQIVAGILAGA